MHKIFSIIICASILPLIIVFGSAPVLANEVQNNDEAGYTQLIPLNDIEVLSIVDNISPLSADKIMGIEKHPEYLKLMPAGAVNSVFKTYLIRIPEHIILLDTGTGDFFTEPGRTLEVLERNGVKPEDVTDILLTHMDFDHVGGLSKDNKALYPNAKLHINRNEYDAWMSGKIGRPKKTVAIVKNIVAPYKEKITFFEAGDEALPNIKAMDISGHTPGHTAFDIDSGDDGLTIVGDLMHVYPIQLRHPEANAVYDIDPEHAYMSRQNTLERLSKNGRFIAGMHFPMIGKVKVDPEGGYMIVSD